MGRLRHSPVLWHAAILYVLFVVPAAIGQDPGAMIPEVSAGPLEPAAKPPPPPAKAPPNPYHDPFYKNDFRYLDDPNFVSRDPFDVLKRLVPVPGTILDLGGEYSLRLHNEYNLRLNNRGNDFLLTRTRLYADLHCGEWFRVYAEAVDSTSSFERLPPRLGEENRWDSNNLFGDLRAWQDSNGGTLTARVGRQELDYGNQRLIASAPWTNTRITYDGARALLASKTWDVDAFWTRLVPLAQHINNDHDFDQSDPKQQLTGLYATRHDRPNETIDAYFLRLENRNPVARGGDGVVGGFDANTVGGRWKGRRDAWLWEAEGAYQFGAYGHDRQSAGFYVVGVGRQFDAVPTTPTLWAYYDWASGDADPTDRRRGTFNQLLPQTHIFLGLGDIVGRQNLRDVNFQLTARPDPHVTLIAELHLFWLQQARDSLYNNAGVPVRTDSTGRAGSRVGQEADFTAQVRLNQHANLLVSYGHFFPGPFLSQTGGSRPADFLYTWLTFKF
ncbi:alginate export family protein [Limnoglobus roseus]|uniref:Alginate export family protein n=1 Tax=Limnoglobus roseus TaxID=2598579 RepID=A0A5C1A687_9BACT|nr:alginate export family protein [Limnoglobus roseus]QEL13352.1 alginate export family protein [Limnoglobus roseus]